MGAENNLRDLGETAEVLSELKFGLILSMCARNMFWGRKEKSYG